MILHWFMMSSNNLPNWHTLCELAVIIFYIYICYIYLYVKFIDNHNFKMLICINTISCVESPYQS